MKLFKAMICFFVLILSLFGAITIYGQQNQTQWIDKFIESFEMTESNNNRKRNGQESTKRHLHRNCKKFR